MDTKSKIKIARKGEKSIIRLDGPIGVLSRIARTGANKNSVTVYTNRTIGPFSLTGKKENTQRTIIKISYMFMTLKSVCATYRKINTDYSDSLFAVTLSM